MQFQSAIHQDKRSRAMLGWSSTFRVFWTCLIFFTIFTNPILGNRSTRLARSNDDDDSIPFFQLFFNRDMDRRSGNPFSGSTLGSEFLGKKKRTPGSEFPEKRVSEFLGKRTPGIEIPDKRIHGSEFLGKRIHGSEFLGKRIHGSEFLGKRIQGSEFLGKRSPTGSEFLGKRAPMGSEFLGKRSPTGSEFLGKRVSEFLGKRSPEQVDDFGVSDRDMRWNRLINAVHQIDDLD